jgi:hypothetical protein
VPERFDLLVNIDDLRFGALPHTVTRIDGFHPKREQFPDLVKRKAQLLGMSDESEAPDSIVREHSVA